MAHLCVLFDHTRVVLHVIQTSIHIASYIHFIFFSVCHPHTHTHTHTLQHRQKQCLRKVKVKLKVACGAAVAGADPRKGEAGRAVAVPAADPRKGKEERAVAVPAAARGRARAVAVAAPAADPAKRSRRRKGLWGVDTVTRLHHDVDRTRREMAHRFRSAFFFPCCTHSSSRHQARHPNVVDGRVRAAHLPFTPCRPVCC